MLVSPQAAWLNTISGKFVVEEPYLWRTTDTYISTTDRLKNERKKPSTGLSVMRCELYRCATTAALTFPYSTATENDW